MTTVDIKHVCEIWDNNRCAWPFTQDGTPMPVMCIPIYPETPLMEIDFNKSYQPNTITYLEFKRVRFKHPSGTDFDAVIYGNIVIEPKALRGLTVNT